jgi:dGTPase
LEVSQIARSIARSLNLNEDLTEAISLGHDLGHTPFGHVGEEVLNKLSPFGFRHNEQSLRVVDFLEKGGEGLNLTLEVREGILKHSKTGIDILGKDWETLDTLEGQICKIADIAAYINHDMDDALRAGIIKESELPQFPISVLGHSRSERINTIVRDIIDYSWVARGGDLTNNQIKPIISVSTPVNQAMNILREFLFEKVYKPSSSEEESKRAKEIVRLLYHYFIEHDEKLPGEYVLLGEPQERRVVDYIAGMTDQYAIRVAESWISSAYN